MAKNIGVLVVGPIRPNDDTDRIPTALANEIEGGFHSVTSSTDRDAIFTNRRKFGMLCYVIDEDRTYQLKLNYASTSLSDNNNWVLYTPGGGSGATEWVDSVISIVNNPSTISPTGGDRYLVGPSGVAAFNNKNNQIAYYGSAVGGSGGWVFTEPTDQTTLRLDTEPNILLVFEGTSSTSGSWKREYQNSVRYINPTSVNGLTYSHITSNQVSLATYSYTVYYANFATANQGTVSLSIDGLPYVDVKKVSANSLVSLVAGDIESGIEYQLTYDSGNFQISIPSAGSSTIGPAEDGDYTDGLYTDFTTSTPIGTAVDRFNEIFKFLVPPSAPNLNSWSVDPQSQFVSGKLSFDGSGGFIPGTTSIYGPTGVGGLFQKGTASGYILGVTSKVSQPSTGTTYYQDITGILNSGVLRHTSTPTPAYVTASFGNGVTGSLALYLNGFTLSTADLGSTYSAIDTTLVLSVSGATSGFVISAATPSKFPTGFDFNAYWNRTGTYRIKRDNSRFVDGYNYIEVKHLLPTSTITLNRYEFISDSSTTVTSYGTPQDTNYNATSKWISGVKYFNFVRFNYSIRASNAYRNTYYPDVDGSVFSDSSPSETVSIYNSGQVYAIGTDGTDVFSPSPSQLSFTVPTSVSDVITFSCTFSTVTSRRRVNNSSRVSTLVKRTVQGDSSGGTLSTSNWFIDTYATSSTTLIENFDDEKYRLVNGSSFTSYNLVSDITTGSWNSQQSLLNTSAYRNALQIANGHLIYPVFNFSSAGNSTTNPNFGDTTTNYTTCKTSTLNPLYGGGQARSYTRYFNLGSTYVNSLRMVVQFSNTTFVPVGTSLASSTQNAYLEIKLPYKGTETPDGGLTTNGSVTGWLDATKIFISGQSSDGSGCYDASNSSGSFNVSGSTWGISFGKQSTYFSDNNVLIRITVGPNYIGNISRISISS